MLWRQSGQHSLRYFCSRQHQDFYAAVKRTHGRDAMIDPTPHEIAAMRAAIQPMAEYIGADIGYEKPLKDYSRAEILTLIEVVVTAYQDALQKEAHAQWPEINIPFDPSKSLGGVK
jgi:hypothetical protein